MRKALAWFLFVLLALPAASSSEERPLVIKAVRYFSYPTFTRVVFETEAAAPYVLVASEDGQILTFSAYEGPLVLRAKLPPINDGVVKSMQLKEIAGRFSIEVSLDLAAGAAKDFVLTNPDRMVIDITRGSADQQPTAQPEESQAVIVIDPGHGGRDTGMVTGRGKEKSATLMLARLLRRKIKAQLPDMKVLFTREKGKSPSLTARAAFSNSRQAVIFLSLHSSPGNDARVYILALGADTVSRRSPPRRDFLGFEAESEQQKMLWGTQQAAHAQASSSLGWKLMAQLTGRKNRGPMQAPLVVLKPVDAAAVMIEVGMKRNRTQVANAVVKGIAEYVRENR